MVVQTDRLLAGGDHQRILFSFVTEQLTIPEGIHPVDGLFMLHLGQLFGDPVPFLFNEGFNLGYGCVHRGPYDKACIAGDDQSDGSPAGAEDLGYGDFHHDAIACKITNPMLSTDMLCLRHKY